MAHNGQRDQVIARRVVMVQAPSQEDERQHDGEDVQLVPTVVPPGLGGAEGGQGVVHDVFLVVVHKNIEPFPKA